MKHDITGYLLIALGLNFLLDNFGLPHFDLGDLARLWPLALIWVGWDMLCRRRRREDLL